MKSFSRWTHRNPLPAAALGFVAFVVIQTIASYHF